MARPNWYNENAARDYPFLQRTAPLLVTDFPGSSAGMYDTIVDVPHGVCCDMGIIMAPNADYALTDLVWLDRIERSGATLTFVFKTDAAGASNYILKFRRNITSREYRIDWEEAELVGTLPDDDARCDEDIPWSGYLVTGDMQLLVDIIDDGETIEFADKLWSLEPARIQSLKDSYVRAVHLANSPRTMVEVPEGCTEDSSASANSDVIVQATCIDGDIKLKEGYNCTIRQDTISNAIIIGAGVGVGEGEPCEEVPLYDGETAPDGSPFLSGGPGCGSVLKSVNGITGKNITLLPGPGVRITPDPVIANQLVIAKAVNDFAVCTPEGSGGAPLLSPMIESVSSSSAGG